MIGIMKNPCKTYFLYLIVFLGLLSAFGPFVIDMYLPALPEMAEVFHCETYVSPGIAGNVGSLPL